MRCLVLGSGGFVGGHLVAALVASGHQVLAYDMFEPSAASRSFVDKVEFIRGDFCSEKKWDQLLSSIDVCFHLISTTIPKSSNDDPVADVRGNLLSTIRLLEAAKSRQVKIIFTSSGGTVYGRVNSDTIVEEHATNPLCSYGINKLAIEKYLLLYKELYGVQSTVLRIANPYGESQRPNAIQGAIGVFMKRILHEQSIDIWGDGTVVRDYIYITDVVDALIAAATYRGAAHVFNVGSGKGVSLIQIIHLVEQVTEKTANITYHSARGFDVQKNVLNIDRIQSELNWYPKVTLLDGLKKTLDWMYRSV